MRARCRWLPLWLTVAATGALPACDSWGGDSSHRPFPIVTSFDGALLAPLHIVTIVSESDTADASFFFSFSAAVGGSAWWHRVAGEYHLGSATAVANITGPAITSDLTDHDIFEYIGNAVAANGGPDRDGNTLYMLYLPAGVTVISAGGIPNTDCATFLAYHAPYGTRGDNLAVVQKCTYSDPDTMTIAASHEIIEAATDPDGQSYILPAIAARAPWTENIWSAYNLTGGAELGDLCELTLYYEGGFLYQRVWSNLDAARGGDPCAPEMQEPFYDTTFEQDWYPVLAGGTVEIPVTGWSTGPVPGWPVEAHVQSSVPGFSAILQSGSGMLNSGQKSQLAVTAPPAAASGSFGVVLVLSKQPPGSLTPTDFAHINYVGVYVP